MIDAIEGNQVSKWSSVLRFVCLPGKLLLSSSSDTTYGIQASLDLASGEVGEGSAQQFTADPSSPAAIIDCAYRLLPILGLVSQCSVRLGRHLSSECQSEAEYVSMYEKNQEQ